MSDSSFPRISVVIPHYNEAKTVAQSLESVCSQDPPPHDVLLLDDCSTDGSLEIIAGFARKYPFFRYIRYPEKSTDWMKAYFNHRHLFTGDYVLMFSGDDLVYPGCFRAITDAVRRFPQAGAVFSNYHHATADLRIVGARMLGVSEVTFLHGALLHRQLCRPWLIESGVASVLKLEAFLWLAEKDLLGLGPWVDSMGFPVIAMKYGAVYLPGIHGCVRLRDASYSVTTGRDEARSVELFQRVNRFLHSPEFEPFVPPVVAAVLERKCLANLPPAVIQRYSTVPLFNQGCQLLTQQRFADACLALEEVARSCPAVPEVYDKLGIAYFSLGRFQEAERAFRQALLFQPNDGILHCNLGACLQAQERPAEAMWCYYQALYLNPNIADAHSNLGAACTSMGRFPEAIQSYQQALRIAPDHPRAQPQLQQLLAALSRPQ